MITLIFDFDGVLADTLMSLAEFTSKKLRISFDRSLGKIISYNLKNRKINWLRQKIQDYEAKNFLDWLEQKKAKDPNFTLLFLDVLSNVETLPYTKYIITNNYLSICKSILDKKTSLFKEIYACDKHLSKKQRLENLVKTENLNLEDCLFFVDTVGDILEYQSIVKTEQIYAVDWGFHSKSILKRFIDEKQILNNPEHIFNVIKIYESSFLESVESKS